jgi:hypothetical protein
MVKTVESRKDEIMFGIFSRAMKTATRTPEWNAPDYWHKPRYPRTTWETQREEAEARRRAMRTTGMW